MVVIAGVQVDNAKLGAFFSQETDDVLQVGCYDLCREAACAACHTDR